MCSGARDNIVDREPSTWSAGVTGRERIAFRIVTGFLGAGKTVIARAALIARRPTKALSKKSTFPC
jgi:type II secretory pathway predicted ATPase ExeA